MANYATDGRVTSRIGQLDSSRQTLRLASEMAAGIALDRSVKLTLVSS